MTDIAATPFDLVGGSEAVERIVDRFYDLIESDADYAGLRDLHGPDLGPVRQGLAAYIAGWLGGPRDWFERPGKNCVMSMHAPLAISTDIAGQWTHAMIRAISSEPELDERLGSQMAEALARMAHGMINRIDAEPAPAS